MRFFSNTVYLESLYAVEDLSLLQTNDHRNIHNVSLTSIKFIRTHQSKHRPLDERTGQNTYVSGDDSATLLIDCAGSEVGSRGSSFNVLISLSSSSSNRGLLHGAGCSDLIAVEVSSSHDASAVLVAILLPVKKDSVWVPKVKNKKSVIVTLQGTTERVPV